MYQQHPNMVTDLTLDDFKELVKGFEKTILKSLVLATDTTEWNLTKTYRINWACIWNKPTNMGKSCTVLFKDDKVAFVAIKGTSSSHVVHNLYRLEDLTLID
jgi:hypothetical protein